jgi:hypothetical protein
LAAGFLADAAAAGFAAFDDAEVVFALAFGVLAGLAAATGCFA